MRRLLLVVMFGVACGAPQRSMPDLTFLTRGDCPTTPDMAARLEAALTELGLPNDYQVVDLDTLPKTDPRTGYPTPTLLYRGKDVFGMAEPTPPFPAPS